MRSAFRRFSAFAVKLLAGLALLAAVIVVSVIALLPEILCVAAVIHGTRMLRVFSVLTLLAALTTCIGCSSKHNPEPAPEPPRVVHWKGQDGYEDTTVVQSTDKAIGIGKQ